MPSYLFRPLVREHRTLDFTVIDALARDFDTSQTATAIRFVESDHTPAMLVCHGPEGRKWFTRSPSVPERWFPQQSLDRDSFAFDVQFNGHPDGRRLSKMDACAWFDRPEANRYEIKEQSIRVGPEETLTLLVFEDDEMLEERARRGYGWGQG